MQQASARRALRGGGGVSNYLSMCSQAITSISAYLQGDRDDAELSMIDCYASVL